MQKPICFLGVLLCFPVLASSDAFWKFYGEGKAELSSYKVAQPRYGELRQGHSVFIFVPEHVHATTRIKIENYAGTPEKDRIQVVKLNRTLYFTTGVYPYSVMTSAFCPLAGGPPLKLSITVNEWCGNVYEHLLPEAGRAKRVRHSYFEGEGDKDDYLKAPKDGIYEDALPILIREFTGPWLNEGEKKEMKILPSLWSSRISHRDHEWLSGWVKKERDGKQVKWTWQVGTRQSTYWVDSAYPHYISKWQGPEGETGERIKTLHLPYWQHNHNTDLKLRKELGLP